MRPPPSSPYLPDAMTVQTLRALLCLLLVIGASLWPYLGGFPHWPMTMDAVLWIKNGVLGNEGWYEWVFQTQHFNVGYRPVTALTYTANEMIGGLSPFIYRFTDFSIHTLCALLIFGLARALNPERPAWTALLPAVVFALHPIVGEVLPFIARRSYSLAACGTLLALILGLRAQRSENPALAFGLSAIVGAILGISFFVHEIALIGGIVLPLLVTAVALREESSPRRGILLSIVPLLVLVGMYFIRAQVVAGIGGYNVDEEEGSRVFAIATAFLRSIFAIDESIDVTVDPIALVTLALALPYYLWAVVAPGLARDWTRTGLLLWLLGYGALYSLLGVWFPRQAYLALLPLSLLVGDVLAGTLTADKATAHKLLHLVPQAALIVSIAFASPVFRGPNQLREERWQQADAMFDVFARELPAVREPAQIRLVLPYNKPTPGTGKDLKRSGRKKGVPRGARQPLRWLETLVRDRDIEFDEFMYFASSAPVTEWATYETFQDRYAVRVPDGLSYMLGNKPKGAQADRLAWVDQPRFPADRNIYLYVASERGGDLMLLREDL